MMWFFGVGAAWKLKASQPAALPLPKIPRGGSPGRNNPDSYVGYQITNMPVYWTLSFSTTTKSNKNSSNAIVPWERCDNHHDDSNARKKKTLLASRQDLSQRHPWHIQVYAPFTTRKRISSIASLFMNFSLSQWRKDPFGVWEVIATIMVKNRGALFISGAFSNLHKPSLFPQPTNNVGLVYPEFFFLWVSTLYRVGEGKLRENFENDALFHEGTQKLLKIMNTSVPSQGLCPWL